MNTDQEKNEATLKYEKKLKLVAEIQSNQKGAFDRGDENEYLNPLVDTHPCDSLSKIKAVAQFMQQMISCEDIDDDITLNSNDQYGLYLINECIINALEFEEYRAGVNMKSNKFNNPPVKTDLENLNTVANNC